MKRLMLALALVGVALLVPTAQAEGTTPGCGGYAAAAGETLVGSLAVESFGQAGIDGSSFALPAAGDYRYVACGTWNNTGYGWVDAEYTNNYPANDGFQDGWPGLGPDFGDLQVNGAFVGWGAFDAGHTYSLLASGASGTVGFGIFDGDAGGKVGGWYYDNTGSLTVDVYSIAPPPAPECKAAPAIAAEYLGSNGYRGSQPIFKSVVNGTALTMSVGTFGRNPCAEGYAAQVLAYIHATWSI